MPRSGRLLRAEVRPIAAGILAAVHGDAAKHDRLARLELIRLQFQLLRLDKRRRAVGRPRLHDDDRVAVVRRGGGVLVANLHFQRTCPRPWSSPRANGRGDDAARRGRALAAGCEQLDRRRGVRQDVNLVDAGIRVGLAEVVEEVNREGAVPEQGNFHAQRPPVVLDRPGEMVRARLDVALAQQRRRANAHSSAMVNCGASRSGSFSTVVSSPRPK